MVVPFVLGGVLFGLLGLAHLTVRRQLARQGYRPEVAPPHVAPELSFDKARTARFRGGSWVGRGRATAPLVRLRADEGWVHLTGSGGMFGGPSPVWIERSVVRRVAPVSTLLGSGVRFETDDGRYDGVIFWSTRPEAVLDALRDRGWPVPDDGPGTAPG